MFGITDIFAYLVGVVLIIVLPGPNSLYCLSVAASRGRRAGAEAMLGILVGDSLLIIATVLGAGTLLKLYPTVFDAIKLIGGCYLAYLGIRLFISAYHTFKNRHSLKNQPLQLAQAKKERYFYRALSLSLTNPKAILFFLSFFVQFADPSYPKPYVTFFVLATLLQLVSFMYLMLLVVSGQTLAQKFAGRPLPMILGMSVVGTLFLGYGINLWLSKL